MWNMWQEQWLLFHEAVFDGENKLVYINPLTTAINVEQQVYSDYKEWASLDLTRYDNQKFEPAARTVAGDPTQGGDFLGATFFMTNGWQIVLTHGIIFDGNLFSDDFDSPFTVQAGTQLARQKFTNLVDKVTPDVTQVGSVVWQTTEGQQLLGDASTAAQNAGLTAQEAVYLTKIFKRLGLDPSDPLINTPTKIYTQSSSLVQDLSGNPETQIIVSTQA